MRLFHTALLALSVLALVSNSSVVGQQLTTITASATTLATVTSTMLYSQTVTVKTGFTSTQPASYQIYSKLHPITGCTVAFFSYVAIVNETVKIQLRSTGSTDLFVLSSPELDNWIHDLNLGTTSQCYPSKYVFHSSSTAIAAEYNVYLIGDHHPYWLVTFSASPSPPTVTITAQGVGSTVVVSSVGVPHSITQTVNVVVTQQTSMIGQYDLLLALLVALIAIVSGVLYLRRKRKQSHRDERPKDNCAS